MQDRLQEVETQLSNLLSPELLEITRLIEDKSYLIELPSPADVDLPIEELASLVARTSNTFGQVARLAGMARAYVKLAKGRYDRKFKTSRVGANDAARDMSAMSASEAEHATLTTAEALAELADAMESATRIASESARKLFDKAQTMLQAGHREHVGRYKEADFTPY
ncbi:MAG TPA: hypothetical protein VJ742_13190 [Nitrososphaera sp.]|nr:hypothetical protein [Nitrososphaera sp.]